MHKCTNCTCMNCMKEHSTVILHSLQRERPWYDRLQRVQNTNWHEGQMPMVASGSVITAMQQLMRGQ